MSATAVKPSPANIDAEVAAAKLEQKFFLIPVGSLSPSSANPRKKIAQDQLEELAASIRRDGVLQPLLVRPAAGELATDLRHPTVERNGLLYEERYEIVTGERRWRAAKLAGLDRVPCLVRMMDDAAALEAQIVENLQRQDISPLEEGAAYRALLRQVNGADEVRDLARGASKLTVAGLADRIGKSQRYVYDRLELLNLSEPAKKALDAGKISASHASELVRLDAEGQKEALNALRDEWGMVRTVDELRDWIKTRQRQIELEKKCAEEQKAGKKHLLVTNPATPYKRPAAVLARERKLRAIAQARNEALRQIVAKVRTWDVRSAAITLAERTRFEGQKTCCRVLGLVPDKLGAAGGFDYRRTLRKHIEKADAAGVQRAIAALSLVPEDGFTSSYFSYGGKETLAAIYAAGKKVGVDVQKLERELAKPKAKARRAA